MCISRYFAVCRSDCSSWKLCATIEVSNVSWFKMGSHRTLKPNSCRSSPNRCNGHAYNNRLKFNDGTQRHYSERPLRCKNVLINNHEDESFGRRRSASLVACLSLLRTYISHRRKRNDVVIDAVIADRCGPHNAS